MRVVLEDGTQLGVLPTHEAMKQAEERGLDLVEISARSRPPVCRIMDYGRFKYLESKKKKESRKHATTMEVKEVKFRPKTDDHDMDFKIKHVKRFLAEGNKVRLVVTFRGREITHPNTGRVVLDKVVVAVGDLAQVEVRPNMENRRMVMLLGPRVGVIKRAPDKPTATQPAADKQQAVLSK